VSLTLLVRIVKRISLVTTCNAGVVESERGDIGVPEVNLCAGRLVMIDCFTFFELEKVAAVRDEVEAGQGKSVGECSADAVAGAGD